MALNIVGSRGDKNDPSYRYKMERIIGKVEGRGNGIKTVIPNAQPLAEQLHRPVTQFLKFFGCELGAQTKWDSKNEKAIVNGAHETKDLQDLVDLYIDKFVLCPTCDLPETTLRVKSSKKEVWHVCVACGGKNMVDMTHKLCTFILKEAKAKKQKKVDKTKTKKKKGKITKEEKEAERARKKKEKKAKKKAAAAKAAAAAAEEGTHVDEEGVTWTTDFSDDAVRMRKLTEMSKRHKNDAADADRDQEDEVDEEEKTREQIVEEGAARVKAALIAGSEVADIKSMVLNLQVAGCLPATDRIVMFYNAVMLPCTTPADFQAAVANDKNRQIFETLVGSLSSGPQGLLGAIEAHFAMEEYVGLAPAVALVLQAFYDGDLLEEDVILKWHAFKAANDAIAQVKAKATPFIDWLKSAEEEEEEGSSEEEKAEE